MLPLKPGPYQVASPVWITGPATGAGVSGRLPGAGAASGEAGPDSTGNGIAGPCGASEAAGALSGPAGGAGGAAIARSAASAGGKAGPVLSERMVLAGTWDAAAIDANDKSPPLTCAETRCGEPPSCTTVSPPASVPLAEISVTVTALASAATSCRCMKPPSLPCLSGVPRLPPERGVVSVSPRVLAEPTKQTKCRLHLAARAMVRSAMGACPAKGGAWPYKFRTVWEKVGPTARFCTVAAISTDDLLRNHIATDEVLNQFGCRAPTRRPGAARAATSVAASLHYLAVASGICYTDGTLGM